MTNSAWNIKKKSVWKPETYHSSFELKHFLHFFVCLCDVACVYLSLWMKVYVFACAVMEIIVYSFSLSHLMCIAFWVQKCLSFVKRGFTEDLSRRGKSGPFKSFSFWVLKDFPITKFQNFPFLAFFLLGLFPSRKFPSASFTITRLNLQLCWRNHASI